MGGRHPSECPAGIVRNTQIIGYSFKDEHINKIITKAIQQFGLKLFIISPKTQNDFFSSLVLSDSIHANQIWEGLAGYYPYYLKDLFPSGGDFSVMARDLFKKLFDINMP